MADSETQYEDGKSLVQITNRMLEKLHVKQRVKHWSEINAHVFVTLFEGISCEPLRDVIRTACTKEDEVHNIQVVIDTLALDILHVSFSHITGEDVVARNKRAIGNLVEVMLGLFEFMEGIGSDISSRASDIVEDPDMVTGELIDEILAKELSKKCDIGGFSAISMPYCTTTSDHVSLTYERDDMTNENSTTDLIALGRSSLDDVSHISTNDTANLIAVGDSRYVPWSPTHQDLSATQSVNANQRSPPFASRYANKYRSATAPLPLSHDGGRREAIHRKGHAAHSATHLQAISPSKTVSSQMDSSLGSIKLPPQPGNNSEDMLSSEFNHLGMRSWSGVAQGATGTGVVSGAAGVLGGFATSSTSSFTHHLYHHFDKPADRAGVKLPDFSSSLPLDNSGSRSCTEKRDHTTRIDGLSTMPISFVRPGDRQHKSTLAVTEHAADLGNHTHSYDNLQHLMQDTVAMSREAVRKSPLRKMARPKDLSSPRDTALSTSTAGPDKCVRRKQSATQKASVKAKPATHSGFSPSKTKLTSAPVSPKGICSSPRRRERADKSNKKVSFKVGRTSNHRPVESDVAICSSRSPLKKTGSPTNGCVSRHRQDNTSLKSATYPNTVDYTRHKHTASRSLFSTVPLTSDMKLQTFAEYLDKYDGILEQRDRLVSTGDETTGMSVPNDSAFEFSDASPCRADEYSGDADDSDDVEAGVKPPQLPKPTHSDHISDDSRHGRMDSIREKLNLEGTHHKVTAQALARLYDMELEDFEEDVAHHMKSTRAKSKDTEQEYKKKVLRPTKTTKIRSRKTSVLRPRVRMRSNSAQPHGRKLVAGRCRKRSASASPAVGRRCRSQVRLGEDDLLPWLLEEFPFLYLSKETLHDLWRKSSRQVEQLTKAQQEVRCRKSKAQVQIEEAQRRHGILKDIMKKELSHNQRMKDLKDRQNHQQAVRTQLKNRRAQSARARRYYDEFQVRARSKMLRKRTREELIFKQLFKDGLDIQRDRIRELRRYAREHREQRSQRERNQLDSIENYYRDQFALVSEAISKERKDIEIKDKAQTKIVEQMKRELRQKMEREIRSFQDQLYRDEDEEYFRQLDADCMRQDLQLCRYQASV